MDYELFEVETWLKQILAEQVGHTRIFNSHRPGAKATSPFVVFTFVPRLPDSTSQRARLMSRPMYNIEVVTKGEPTETSEAMVKAIDDYLDDEDRDPFQVGDLQITTSRLNAISRRTPGLTAEEYFIHRGGSYQFWVS